jgi:hypothetical protein
VYRLWHNSSEHKGGGPLSDFGQKSLKKTKEDPMIKLSPPPGRWISRYVPEDRFGLGAAMEASRLGIPLNVKFFETNFGALPSGETNQQDSKN